MKGGTLDMIVMILVVVGAINWGLVGLLNLNLVSSILGEALSKYVYILVGAAGLWSLYKQVAK